MGLKMYMNNCGISGCAAPVVLSLSGYSAQNWCRMHAMEFGYGDLLKEVPEEMTGFEKERLFKLLEMIAIFNISGEYPQDAKKYNEYEEWLKENKPK